MGTENHRILEKSMRMLEVVSNHPEGISLTDLCAEVDVAKGSAHSLLTTLVNMGYLRRDPRTSLYTVSLKTFEVGARFVENNRHFRYAREVLENLVASIRQTAHMAVLDGTDVIYIHKVDCSHAIRMVSIIGRRIPAHATAIGKALLADYTNEQVRALYEGKPLARLTENTISDLDALIEQLEQVRLKGYAYEKGESTIGIECVAVAVGRADDPTHTAISISVPINPARADMSEYITPILEAKQYLQVMM